MKMIKVLAERINRKVAPMHTVGYNATIAETAKLFVKENIGDGTVGIGSFEQGFEFSSQCGFALAEQVNGQLAAPAHGK